MADEEKGRKPFRPPNPPPPKVRPAPPRPDFNKNPPPRGKAPAKPPPPKPAKPGKPPNPPPKEKVTFRCTHAFTPKSLAAMSCHQCWNLERRAKRRKERGVKRKRAGIPKIPREYPKVYRLPPGARKEMDWDGANWAGVLTVPGCPEPFRLVAPSEKFCYHGLHRMYVAWLIEAGRLTPHVPPTPPSETPRGPAS